MYAILYVHLLESLLQLHDLYDLLKVGSVPAYRLSQFIMLVCNCLKNINIILFVLFLSKRCTDRKSFYVFGDFSSFA